MSVEIHIGDAREKLGELPEKSIRCAVTSPPYWGLRKYKEDSGLIGCEPDFDSHARNLIDVFRRVRRTLCDDGTLWLNYGDAYCNGKNFPGLKPKDLILMPARIAMAMQNDGWYLRSEIIWHKPQAMPESVRDRPTQAQEKMLMFAKSSKYLFNWRAIGTPAKESILRVDKPNRWATSPSYHGNHPDIDRDESKIYPGRRAGQEIDIAHPRNVWPITSGWGFRGAHFAVFPPELAEKCILAGSNEGDTVLDPFGGAGTAGMVADRLRRDAVLIEISPEYAEMARRRINGDAPLFGEAARIAD